MSRSSSRGRGAATAPPEIPPTPSTNLWGEFVGRLQAKGRTFAQISRSGDRAAVLRACGFADPLDVAALETEWSSRGDQQDSTAALIAQFERQDRRAREKWSAKADALRAEREAITKQPLKELQAEYLELCKAAQLTMEDAYVVGYLLYSGDEERHLLAANIMRKENIDRYLAHNFAIAARREEAFIQIHGDKLLACRFPLFPADGAFSALNTRLLGGETATGGSGTTKLFKPGEGTAGRYVPVGQFNDGSWGADVTTLEQQNVSLYRHIQGLERKVSRLTGEEDHVSQQRGRGRGRSRGRGYARGGEASQGETDDALGGAPAAQSAPAPTPKSDGKEKEVKTAMALLNKKAFRVVQEVNWTLNIKTPQIKVCCSRPTAPQPRLG